MATKKIHDTHADDYIRGTRHDDWIVNQWGADTIYGRKGDDLVVSSSGDDFIFFGGRGNDVVEIVDVHKNWEWTITVDPSDSRHTTIEFFTTNGHSVPKVQQTVELYAVEDIHIHHDNPFFLW